MRIRFRILLLLAFCAGPGSASISTSPAAGGSGDALTSGTLAQFSATTSAQLRGVLSDESGTGVILTSTGSGASLTSLPAGYKLDLFGIGAGSPADSTTYFIGGDVAAASGAWLNTTYANASIPVPAAGTITRYYIKVRIRTQNGTAEDVTHTLRINDTTDIGSQALDYDTAMREATVTGLSTAVAVGDTITLKIVCPAWVTNPTGVSIYGWVWIQ